MQVGLDSQLTLKFTLGDASQIEKQKIHPEDKALDNEPATVFEMINQGMNGGAPEYDSDFEDDTANKKKGKGKNTPKQQQQQQEDEDEDGGGEEEEYMGHDSGEEQANLD